MASNRCRCREFPTSPDTGRHDHGDDAEEGTKKATTPKGDQEPQGREGPEARGHLILSHRGESTATARRRPPATNATKKATAQEAKPETQVDRWTRRRKAGGAPAARTQAMIEEMDAQGLWNIRRKGQEEGAANASRRPAPRRSKVKAKIAIRQIPNAANSVWLPPPDPHTNDGSNKWSRVAKPQR